MTEVAKLQIKDRTELFQTTAISMGMQPNVRERLLGVLSTGKIQNNRTYTRGKSKNNIDERKQYLRMKAGYVMTFF